MLTRPIRDKTLKMSYSHRIKTRRHVAELLALALLRTHAPADRRQWMREPNNIERFLKPAVSHELEKRLDRHAHRTAILADGLLALKASGSFELRTFRCIALVDFVKSLRALFGSLLRHIDFMYRLKRH